MNIRQFKRLSLEQQLKLSNYHNDYANIFEKYIILGTLEEYFFKRGKYTNLRHDLVIETIKFMKLHKIKHIKEFDKDPNLLLLFKLQVLR